MIFKIREVAGRVLIDKGISTFENITKNLEQGIAHCSAEVDRRNVEISKHNTKIVELGGHITRATKIKNKIDAILKD